MIHYPIGLVRKFTLRYLTWKSNKKVVEPAHTISTGIVEKIIRSNLENLRFYETLDVNRPLTEPERKNLRSIVLGYYFSKNTRLTANDIHNISKDIIDLFPLEHMSSYYDPSAKTGPLYNEYHNKAKKLRAANLYPTFKQQKKKNEDAKQVEVIESVIIQPPKEDTPNDAVISDDLVKVVTSSMDLASLKEHWRNSAQIRTDKIKSLPKTSKLTNILSEYPLYKRADGYAFVSHFVCFIFIIRNNKFYILQIGIDFDHLYPNTTKDFVVEFNMISVKLHRILVDSAKSPYLKNLLELYTEVNENSKVAILLIGLHQKL